MRALVSVLAGSDIHVKKAKAEQSSVVFCPHFVRKSAWMCGHAGKYRLCRWSIPNGGMPVSIAVDAKLPEPQNTSRKRDPPPLCGWMGVAGDRRRAMPLGPGE